MTKKFILIFLFLLQSLACSSSKEQASDDSVVKDPNLNHLLFVPLSPSNGETNVSNDIEITLTYNYEEISDENLSSFLDNPKNYLKVTDVESNQYEYKVVHNGFVPSSQGVYEITIKPTVTLPNATFYTKITHPETNTEFTFKFSTTSLPILKKTILKNSSDNGLVQIYFSEEIQFSESSDLCLISDNNEYCVTQTGESEPNAFHYISVPSIINNNNYQLKISKSIVNSNGNFIDMTLSSEFQYNEDDNFFYIDISTSNPPCLDNDVWCFGE